MSHRVVPDMAGARAPRGRPRVVIAGAGFGGLAAAKVLAGKDIDVTIVDQENYHLFQPLLYQVATAGLSPNQIATPIRQIVSRASNIKVLMDEVTGIDKDSSELVTKTSRIAFDHLIIATGARHTYFGNNHWEVVAPGLKKIDDAINIRRRLLLAFELAEQSTDEGDGPAAPDLRGHWRRADRRGNGGCHCRAGPQGCGARFPQHRSVDRTRGSGRGRTSHSPGLS